jgi:GGDEF domain-containing protein
VTPLYLALYAAILVLRHRLIAALRRAKALSTTDPLTGLLNRRGLAERAPRLVRMARAGRTGLRHLTGSPV